jgi:hypothetical protein
MPMTAAPPSTRPKLELGPLGGDLEYLKTQVESLLRTFSALLDTEIKLVHTQEGGKTDCFTTIWLPLHDPEVYLVAEHELSHWLFESDTYLAAAFVKSMVTKLLNKAGYKPGTDAALPYERKLSELVHGLANLLEDHRVAGLWGELYPGGEDLLRQRWEGIVHHDIPDSAAEENILVYFMKSAHGIDVDTAPDDFKNCKVAYKRALNLVEGVDAASCLGITARLVEEIADELIANNPPPQQQQGQSKQGRTGNSGQHRKGRARKRKEDRQAEGRQQVQRLTKLMPTKGRFASGKDPSGADGMGAGDVVEPQDPRSRAKAERKASGRMLAVKRIMKADSEESDETGRTPLQQMMYVGAEQMNNRIEAARAAMLRNQDDSEQAQAQIFLGWSRVAGIPKKEVTPVAPLPEPTLAAYDARRALEQFRMQKRRKKSTDGDLNISALLDALGSGELDRPLYTNKVKVARFELLFLFDYSGSMFMGQAMQMLERAVSDSVFATESIKCKANMWAYSNEVYIFTRTGAIRGATGLQSGGTMMVQALDLALMWAKQAPTKRGIIHTTDGFPTSCRAHNSTGDPIQDLRAVMEEIRGEGVPISTLAVHHSFWQTTEAATAQYDAAFGEGRYGLLSTMDDVPGALVHAVTDLAKGHIRRSVRNT